MSGESAVSDHLHLCIHEADWDEFRDFKSLSEIQVEHDNAFRTEIITEIRGLRVDVTSALTQMGEYLGMGKMVRFGIWVFASVAGGLAAVLGVGHAIGWW